MEIIWNENPLRTTVKLTDQEREIFLLKARIRDFEDCTRMAVFYLDAKAQEKGRFSPERAISYLNHARRDKEPDEDGGLEMLKAVESGYHCGDCTCVATTCDKCLGEDMLGINTIKGLKKHQAVKIEGAFGRDSTRSFPEAVAALADYHPSKTGHWETVPDDKFEEYAVEWKKQAAEALVWLRGYGTQHGFG